VVYVAIFALAPLAGGWGDLFDGRIALLGPVLALGIAFLPQVAFVAGCLALLRALRLRRAAVVGDAELRLLRRRNAVALAATATAVGFVAVYALDYRGQLAAWWTWGTLVRLRRSDAAVGRLCAGAARGGETASRSRHGSGRRLRRPRSALPAPSRRAPRHRGPPVAVRAPERVRRRHRRLRRRLVRGGRSGSGLVRGLLEAVALVICFAALGPTLGLRHSKGKEPTCAD
jgi:hypothetical protein